MPLGMEDDELQSYIDLHQRRQDRLTRMKQRSRLAHTTTTTSSSEPGRTFVVAESPSITSQSGQRQHLTLPGSQVELSRGKMFFFGGTPPPTSTPWWKRREKDRGSVDHPKQPNVADPPPPQYHSSEELPSYIEATSSSMRRFVRLGRACELIAVTGVQKGNTTPTVAVRANIRQPSVSPRLPPDALCDVLYLAQTTERGDAQQDGDNGGTSAKTTSLPGLAGFDHSTSFPGLCVRRTAFDEG